jgi:DNA-binding NarL/FixJ family response regulator
VNGATNRQIAQALFITVDTVKKHLTSVYDASGCTNRTELAAKWHTSGSRPLPASSRHQHIPELYS